MLSLLRQARIPRRRNKEGQQVQALRGKQVHVALHARRDACARARSRLPCTWCRNCAGRACTSSQSDSNYDLHLHTPPRAARPHAQPIRFTHTYLIDTYSHSHTHAFTHTYLHSHTHAFFFARCARFFSHTRAPSQQAWPWLAQACAPGAHIVYDPTIAFRPLRALWPIRSHPTHPLTPALA